MHWCGWRSGRRRSDLQIHRKSDCRHLLYRQPCSNSIALRATPRCGRRHPVVSDTKASRRCGQLEASVTGDPVRVSVCHCLDCQKRTGSAFFAQARWPENQVRLEGASKIWSHLADSGNKITHYFCPDCGSTVHYCIEGKFDGLVAVPLGAFADPPSPLPNSRCGKTASMIGSRSSATM